MNLTEKAQTIFASDRYATEMTGVRLIQLDAHQSICQMEVTPQHRNAMGGVMGGAMFTLADFAFATAANSDCIAQDLALQWVSIESSIHYLSNTTDCLLTARAKAVKHGTRTCLYHIEVSDSKGKILAIVETTGMRL